MKRNRTLRIWGGFLLLLLLLFTFLIWNIFAGSVSLSASEIWRILLGGDVGFTQSQIIVKIRLPRLLSALILGGALSLSGYLLQTFFHNPIAGPFVLGISSGAKMTVCVAMLALLSRGKTTSSAILIAAAFVGAMVSMGFVLLISQRVKRMSLLVVCGVMIFGLPKIGDGTPLGGTNLLAIDSRVAVPVYLAVLALVWALYRLRIHRIAQDYNWQRD